MQISLGRLCPRRRRSRCCLSVAMLFVVVVITIRIFIASVECSREESIRILKQLCREYYNGNVVGNLCSDLCDTYSLQFVGCINYHGGKAVFRMKWKEETVILKAKKQYINDYNLPIYIETLSDIVKMVADSVNFNLPVKPGTFTDKELFTKLWKDDFEKYIVHDELAAGNSKTISWKRAACNSLWSLLQQDEYQLIALYQNYSYFPQLYGTCGHFYALNNMPPGDLLSPFTANIVKIWNQPWKSRAPVALKLINLMQNFDETFSQVLHMCDMKGENFGISEDGTVRAIDVDMAIFENRLESDLSYSNCTKHDDCSFFDCHGWCDVAAKRCFGIRTNNNLQILCEKILQSHGSNAFTGLLHSPPSSVPELTSIISECAVPSPPMSLLPGCTKAGKSVRCLITPDKYPIRHRAEKNIMIF